MRFYTYMWLREDGTPYYVGKGRGQRAFRKHRVGNAPPDDRIIIQNHSCEIDALNAEVFLIAHFGRKDIGTGILRNLSDGGDSGTRGWKQPESTRHKHRMQRLGKRFGPMSMEGRRRVSEAHRKPWTQKQHDARKGKTLSAKHRENIRISRLGKHFSMSTEGRENISRARIAHWQVRKALICQS